MQMSHFSTDLLTGFHKPTPNQTRFPNPGFHDSEDRLSSTSNAKSQPLIPPRHVAPSAPYDKDPMFEKPLTPSDVGKLNRLVIPKQHAEKYFPLGGAGDAAGGLLGFEDEAGKCWQFRYSYWNSSQSYVLTKGWSRYVKEKGLDAGDVVFFERHRSEPNRLFIGWRRRGTAPIQQPAGVRYNAPGYGVAQDSVLGLNLFQSDFRRHTGGRGGTGKEEEEQGGSGDAGGTNSNSPRLVRLFGVNLECSQTTSSQVSSHPIQLQQQQQQEEGFRHYFNCMGHHHNHMLMGELMDGGSDK